jgi:PAS domain S-box-containing protein
MGCLTTFYPPDRLTLNAADREMIMNAGQTKKIDEDRPGPAETDLDSSPRDDAGITTDPLGAVSDAADAGSESQNQFRFIGADEGVGLGLIDAKRRYTVANFKYTELLDIQADNVHGLAVTDVQSALDVEYTAECLDRAFSGEQVADEMHLRVRGDQRYYSVCYEPLIDNDSVSHVAAVITDLTKRKQVDLERQKIEQRYRTLFEYSPDGVLIADRESNFFDANESMCRMLGYRREELVGLHASSIVASSEVPRIDQALGVIHSGSEYQQQWQLRRKDGSLFDVEVIATAMPDGNLLGVVRDITNRKREEAARSYLAAIVGASEDPIVSKDLNGVITTWNSAAERMFGYSAQEIIGKPMEQLIPQDRLNEEPQILACIVRGETIDHFETVRVTKEGAPINVSITISPIKDADGIVVGASKIVRDITESKGVAERISQLNAELELRVTERTSELEAVNKELESFSYSVSHDLRAPLRHLNGFSLALLEDYSDKLDEKGKGFLRELRGASQQMSLLIDDVLQLAQVTRSEMFRETVDMTELVTQILEAMQKIQPERTVSVAVQEGLAAYGDKRLLGIALTNLLGNSWKFTSKKENPAISFGRETRDGKNCYFVRDNGAGFDMAYVGKLFGAFQRLHSANEFEGTGIGLANVQRIINRHGGRVWAEGAVDAGATFYLTLPDGDGK